MNSALFFIVFVVTVGLVVYIITKDKKPYLKFEYIDNYQFPSRVKEAVLKEYPHLSKDDTDLVLKALKDYFKIALLAKGKMVYMPSRVVDVAWHEFLLFTKEYEKFSVEIFGKFFHHHPSEVMDDVNQTKKSIDLTYKNACSIENLDAKYPHKMPLIFEIDKLLKIDDGYKYDLKALAKYKENYSSSCGGSASCKGSYGNGVSSADGVSCGGGSCGGGCGGS